MAVFRALVINDPPVVTGTAVVVALRAAGVNHPLVAHKADLVTARAFGPVGHGSPSIPRLLSGKAGPYEIPTISRQLRRNARRIHRVGCSGNDTDSADQ